MSGSDAGEAEREPGPTADGIGSLAYQRGRIGILPKESGPSTRPRRREWDCEAREPGAGSGSPPRTTGGLSPGISGATPARDSLGDARLKRKNSRNEHRVRPAVSGALVAGDAGLGAQICEEAERNQRRSHGWRLSSTTTTSPSCRRKPTECGSAAVRSAARNRIRCEPRPLASGSRRSGPCLRTRSTSPPWPAPT